MEKKRVIVDYKNITNSQLELLSDAFPYGFEDDDTIKFKNAKGELVSAIPLETPDTKYLFKVSVELEKKMDNFSIEDEDDDEETSEPDTEIEISEDDD